MHGHLNKITTSAGDFEYTRLASSDLVSQMTRPNGVTTTWAYEQNRNLITQVANGTISTYGYTNDTIGRRSFMSRSGSAHPAPDTISYSYNDRSEVTGAVSDNVPSYSYAYVYDPIGNRTSANEAGVPWTYTTNSLNQYTVATEDNVQLNFTYDLDGSMTYRPVDATTGWTQIWNGENRMVETYKGTERLTFQYDFIGRRVEKKVYDGQTLTTHLKFVYDGFKLVEELDGINADAPLRHYAWQPDDVGLDVVLQMSDVSNAADFFHLHDANKNVMQIVDERGIAVAGYAYSPFGNAIGELPSDFGFSSEYSEPEILLLHFNYRQYVPQTGKWLSRDPIGENSGLNIYQFVRNSPLFFYDYLGLACCGDEEWDPKTKCCVNNKKENKVKDDAREECCHNELKTIELRNKSMIPFIRSGHSFIYLPDREIGYGFHPRNGSLDSIFSIGEVRTYDENKPYDKKLTYKYYACPKSILYIVNIISNDRDEDSNIFYNFLNIIGWNCSGRACKWLEDSGFVPPFNPRKGTIVPSPWPFGKGGYDPRRDTRYDYFQINENRGAL